MASASPSCIAFEDHRRLAAGSLADVTAAVKRRAARAGHGVLLVFDAVSGQQIDLDFRKDAGTSRAAPQDTETEEKSRRGRPRLGVTPREVTLLPRHWEWLNAQPGGASVALRKLVDEARRVRGPADGLRARQEAAYRFMAAIAGDLPFYEDAIRALFAGDASRFAELTGGWPTDVRAHAQSLASAAFARVPKS